MPEYPFLSYSFVDFVVLYNRVPSGSLYRPPDFSVSDRFPLRRGSVPSNKGTVRRRPKSRSYAAYYSAHTCIFSVLFLSLFLRPSLVHKTYYKACPMMIFILSHLWQECLFRDKSPHPRPPSKRWKTKLSWKYILLYCTAIMLLPYCEGFLSSILWILWP